MTSIKVAISGCGHIAGTLHTNPTLAALSQSSKIAERLLAHARLCRQIAGQSWNEETADELTRLADECDRAAAKADADDVPAGPVQ